jgi:hypothetical protein
VDKDGDSALKCDHALGNWDKCRPWSGRIECCRGGPLNRHPSQGKAVSVAQPRSTSEMGPEDLLTDFPSRANSPRGLALVSAGVGIHSTPGIWLMILSLPGIAVGIVASTALRENNLVLCVATTLANWAFYVCIVIGVVSLKRKLYEWGILRPPK